MSEEEKLLKEREKLAKKAAKLILEIKQGKFKRGSRNK